MFTKEIARTDQNAKCKRDFKDTNASLADDEVQLGKLCPQGRQSIFSKKPCLSTKEFASTGEKVGKSNSIEIQTAEEKGQKHKRRETRSAPHAAFNTLQLCFEEESLEELARIDENAESKKESLEEGEGDMDEMHAGLSTRDLEQLVTVGTLQDDGLLQVPYVARCVFCTQQTLFTEMPTKKSNRICMRVIGTRVVRGARVERRCRQKSKARAFVMFTKEIARTDQNAKCKRD